MLLYDLCSHIDIIVWVSLVCKFDTDDGPNRAVMVVWQRGDTQFTNTKDTDHHFVVIITVLIPDEI